MKGKLVAAARRRHLPGGHDRVQLPSSCPVSRLSSERTTRSTSRTIPPAATRRSRGVVRTCEWKNTTSNWVLVSVVLHERFHHDLALRDRVPGTT